MPVLPLTFPVTVPGYGLPGLLPRWAEGTSRLVLVLFVQRLTVVRFWQSIFAAVEGRVREMGSDPIFMAARMTSTPAPFGAFDVRIDPWAVEYGGETPAELRPDPDDPSDVDLGVERDPQDWTPIPPAS